MNYEILAKMLYVRKKFSRSIWKSKVVIINSGAGFVKVENSNLVKAELQNLKTSVPFMICSSTGSSQWVEFIFFSGRYNNVKQFKWYFASIATMSLSDSVAIRLKLLRLYSSSVWHLWRFFGSSFLPQKKHISKVFLNSRLFHVFLLYFLSSKFLLQLPVCFLLSFCLLYTAIHDLWHKALFSRNTASVKVFCRALHLLFTAFCKPSKLRNSFKLSAIMWSELFSRSKLEKQILHIKHKLQVLLFFPSKFQKIYSSLVDTISRSCS